MFTAKTSKIEMLAKENPTVIKQLEGIFSESTRIYIDYANVRPWSEKLGWHIELKRLKQFLDSFSNVKSVSLYNGYLENDLKTAEEIKELERQNYRVRTKPVKIMRLNINASSIKQTSIDLLKQFVRMSLLRRYRPETIKMLNKYFVEMNERGEYFIEDKKCNFDVEISTDMLLDCERNETQNFILWSGDSDFSDTIQKLLKAEKKVFLFATARRVAKEISELEKDGLFIYDIQKIRDFICWSREISHKRKEDLVAEAPKL